jgi:hypothetical protein
MNTVGSSERVFPQARAQDDITVSHFDFNRWRHSNDLTCSESG